MHPLHAFYTCTAEHLEAGFCTSHWDAIYICFYRFIRIIWVVVRGITCYCSNIEILRLYLPLISVNLSNCRCREYLFLGPQRQKLQEVPKHKLPNDDVIKIVSRKTLSSTTCIVHIHQLDDILKTFVMQKYSFAIYSYYILVVFGIIGIQ